MRAPVLTFLGATGTVTGSRFLIDTADGRVLVDCGMYQGLKELRLRNRAEFPVDPSSIDAVVLTHAHVDHCGYLPALCRDGFAGSIVCSEATAALTSIVLPDSGHLQEEEAAFANRKGFSKHHPAQPLYTEDDARRCLSQLGPVLFDTEVEVAPGVHVTLRPAGHILGSASVAVRLDANGRRLVFSGDLGRPVHPLLRPPRPVGDADLVVVESTYGDRRHDDAGTVEQLRDAINRTITRGGTVVVPAFAVDRTEIVLYHLRRLREAGSIPDVPVYVDSPMALASLDVYRAAVADKDVELRDELYGGEDPFDGGALVEVRDVEDSKRIDESRFPSIIVSASGMATGGRVLHHLERHLPDPRSTIVLVGFQAEGTRGRALSEASRQIKLLGRYVAVRAEIVDLPAMSVHADRDELVDWLGTAIGPPETVFAVHGEPSSSAALCAAAEQRLGWPAIAPRYLERVRLD